MTRKQETFAAEYLIRPCRSARLIFFRETFNGDTDKPVHWQEQLHGLAGSPRFVEPVALTRGPDGSGLASERYLSTLHSRGIPAPSTRADAACRSCLDRPQFYAPVASFWTTIPGTQSFLSQRESTLSPYLRDRSRPARTVSVTWAVLGIRSRHARLERKPYPGQDEEEIHRVENIALARHGKDVVRGGSALLCLCPPATRARC